MSKQSGKQTLSEVEQEAIAWLIKLDGDHQPKSEDLARLREWLSRSPAHRRALNQANRFWSNTSLTELVVPLVQPRRTPFDWLFYFFFRFFKRWQLATTGAAIGLAATVFVVFNLVSPVPPELKVYTTAVGQQEVITLSDGSLAHLNTNTQLQVQYSKHARLLRLVKGEVHFNVSHNPSKPFRVYGGGGVVEAIGTAFTVSLLNRQMDVLVTEGLVAVSAHNEPPVAVDSPMAQGEKETNPSTIPYDIGSIPPGVTLQRLATLSAGQKISIEQAIRNRLTTKGYNPSSSAVTTLSQRDVEQHESWRRGLLIFTGEPLFRVIEEISRFTEVAVEIADPELRDLEIGGRFKVGDVEAMLVSLEANFNVDIDRISDDKIVIKASK